jgi:hypothetical protein
MTAEAVTAIISAAGALLVAVAGYLFTKHAEREAAWRTEKLAHYKALLASLSGILKGHDTDEGQVAFARACNEVLLFAPSPVLVALFRFQDEIRASNLGSSQQGHDDRLRDLVVAIRRDLRIPRSATPADLPIRLWAPGPATPRRSLDEKDASRAARNLPASGASGAGEA